MVNSYMLLPKMQLVGDYTQNGEDAAYVGGARAVAFQFFADGWTASSGAVAAFTIQHATSNSDDHFVDSAVTASITEGTAGQAGYTKIVVSDIDQLAAYVRVKVVLTLNGSPTIDVKTQINVMGSGR